ncbi:hypothetical protein QEN19_003529 [Hanseniaspora menglaensis]
MFGGLRRTVNYIKRSNNNSNAIGLVLVVVFLCSLILMNLSSKRDDLNLKNIEIISVPGASVIENGALPGNSIMDEDKTVAATPSKTLANKESSKPTTEIVDLDNNDDAVIHALFNKIIHKIFGKYDPKISNPYSQFFSEKDTSNKLIESSLGSYLKKCPSPGYWEESMSEQWPLLTYKSLQNSYLQVQDTVKNTIKNTHTSFIEEINKSEDMAYPGTKKYKGDGIVFVAGGKFSVLAYSVIKMIRNRGTKLPIEVLIPDSDNLDKGFCQILSNELNGKCIYLNSIFDDEILKTYEFKGFQYKSLALMASSFENCLLLDADDYPLKNLDEIFKNDAFTKNGLVLWPDFWRRTTHPFFYESAGIKVNLEKRVRNFIDSWSPMKSVFDKSTAIPYHDFEGTLPDPSSETGQMMISKKHHWKTLLLSLYYNVHGPNLYYHLLSQYAAGQGDKDTFIAAAHVMDLPYYQVLSVPSLDGYHQKGEDGGYRGIAYYQKDFRQDYEIKNNLIKIMKKNSFAKESVMEDYNPIHFRDEYFKADISKSSALFAHCNLPKFNPVSLAHNQEYTYEGNHFRGLNSKECLGDLDMEQEIIQSYYDVICGKTENIFQWLVDKNDELVCDYMSKRLKLFKEEPL